MVEEASSSILILRRTRRSLSASACPANSKSQLLDNALARQIAVRQAELDSLLPRSVSVIVRSSTPDPEASCENEGCLDRSVFRSTNSNPWPLVPEDYKLPLHHFLNSIQTYSPHHQPHSPDHQAGHLAGGAAGGRTPVIQKAPTVPWSPTRAAIFRYPENSSRVEALSNILTEFDPFFDTTAEAKSTQAESLSKMNLADAKADCTRNEERFTRLTRRYEPKNYDAAVVLANKDTWTEKISTALDGLIDSVDSMTLAHHSNTDAEQEIRAWKEKINQGEAVFTNIVNQFGRRAMPVNQDVSSNAVPALNQQQTSSGIQSQAVQPFSSLEKKKAQVNVDLDAEEVSKEGVSLEHECRKYDDWEEADDEEVEEYMGKIEEWRKRFLKMNEKVKAIERNTKIFDLDETKMKSSLALFRTVECQMETAVENIKFENDARCLYSLSKSKTASVKLPSFSGEQE